MFPKTEPKMEGMEKVIASIAFLQKLGSTVAGVELVGRIHPVSGIPVSEIIEHLANGNDRSTNQVKRDIRLTAEDATQLAELYNKKLLQELQAAIDAGTPLDGSAKGDANKAAAAKRATRAARNSLMAAGRGGVKILKGRIETATGNDGNPLIEVTPDYAEWRQGEYGIPKGEVYKATGFTLNNFSVANLKLTKKK